MFRIRLLVGRVSDVESATFFLREERKRFVQIPSGPIYFVFFSQFSLIFFSVPEIPRILGLTFSSPTLVVSASAALTLGRLLWAVLAIPRSFSASHSITVNPVSPASHSPRNLKTTFQSDFTTASRASFFSEISSNAM